MGQSKGGFAADSLSARLRKPNLLKIRDKELPTFVSTQRVEFRRKSTSLVLNTLNPDIGVLIDTKVVCLVLLYGKDKNLSVLSREDEGNESGKIDQRVKIKSRKWE